MAPKKAKIAKAKAAPFKKGNEAGRRKINNEPSSKVSNPRRRLDKRDRPAENRKEKNAALREKHRLRKIAESKQTDSPLPDNWHPRKYGKDGDGPSSYTNNEVADLQDNVFELKKALAKSESEKSLLQDANDELLRALAKYPGVQQRPDRTNEQVNQPGFQELEWPELPDNHERDALWTAAAGGSRKDTRKKKNTAAELRTELKEKNAALTEATEKFSVAEQDRNSMQQGGQQLYQEWQNTKDRYEFLKGLASQKGLPMTDERIDELIEKRQRRQR